MPVIVHPTQLVPVLPAASQSVVKRVLHTPTSSGPVTPPTAPPVIVKTEQGIILIVMQELTCLIVSIFSKYH